MWSSKSMFWSFLISSVQMQAATKSQDPANGQHFGKLDCGLRKINALPYFKYQYFVQHVSFLEIYAGYYRGEKMAL